MITVTRELSLENFEAWSGAVDRLERIKELDIVEEATNFINECFGYTEIDETALNDFLWFEMDEFIESFEK